jgi:hypothetical protein
VQNATKNTSVFRASITTATGAREPAASARRRRTSSTCWLRPCLTGAGRFSMRHGSFDQPAPEELCAVRHHWNQHLRKAACYVPEEGARVPVSDNGRHGAALSQGLSRQHSLRRGGLPLRYPRGISPRSSASPQAGGLLGAIRCPVVVQTVGSQCWEACRDHWLAFVFRKVLAGGATRAQLRTVAFDAWSRDLLFNDYLLVPRSSLSPCGDADAGQSRRRRDIINIR